MHGKPAIPSCLRIVFRYIARMTDRTNHRCSSGHAAVSLRLRGFAVRVPELQGPACGRFMRWGALSFIPEKRRFSIHLGLTQ